MADNFKPIMDAALVDMGDVVANFHAELNSVANALAVMPAGTEKTSLEGHEGRVDAIHLQYEAIEPLQVRASRDRDDMLVELGQWATQLLVDPLPDQAAMRAEMLAVVADIELADRP